MPDASSVDGKKNATEKDYDRQRTYADWRLAADLFAHGFGIAEVAAALHCPVRKVQRNLRESRRLRRWIAEAEARAALAAATERRLAELRRPRLSELLSPLSANGVRRPAWDGR